MLRWLLVLLAAVLTVKAQALARLLSWAVNAVASKELAKGLHNAGLTNCDDRVNKAHRTHKYSVVCSPWTYVPLVR